MQKILSFITADRSPRSNSDLKEKVLIQFRTVL